MVYLLPYPGWCIYRVYSLLPYPGGVYTGCTPPFHIPGWYTLRYTSHIPGWYTLRYTPFMLPRWYIPWGTPLSCYPGGIYSTVHTPHATRVVYAYCTPLMLPGWETSAQSAALSPWFLVLFLLPFPSVSALFFRFDQSRLPKECPKDSNIPDRNVQEEENVENVRKCAGKGGFPLVYRHIPG